MVVWLIPPYEPSPLIRLDVQVSEPSDAPPGNDRQKHPGGNLQLRVLGPALALRPRLRFAAQTLARVKLLAPAKNQRRHISRIGKHGNGFGGLAVGSGSGGTGVGPPGKGGQATGGGSGTGQGGGQVGAAPKLHAPRLSRPLSFPHPSVARRHPTKARFISKSMSTFCSRRARRWASRFLVMRYARGESHSNHRTLRICREENRHLEMPDSRLGEDRREECIP